MTAAWFGAAVRALAFLSLVALCVAGVRWVSRGAHEFADHWNHPSSHVQNLSALAGPRTSEIQARNRRLVYPYSVIPGGVSSAEELHDSVAHDPTVAEHYAGFNYNHARVIEVSQPQLVYVSYRRSNKVFWTRRQMSLHPGEKLLTDGKITARTRCGNQVSVLPQANISPDEPLVAELDRPDAVASGMLGFPGSLASSLLGVDPPMPIGPGTPGGGSPIAGPPTGFIPLPVGSPNPPPGTPITGGCTPPQTGTNCNPPPPPPPPPVVPEPGSIILMMTGAAAVLARFRGNRK